MKPIPAQAEYDQLAPVYNERWASYTEATLRATLDGLKLRRGDRVLDLASGTGELTRRVMDRPPDLFIVGVDISRGMLSRGTGDRVQGDATRLSLASGTFDQVLCTNAFHMFPRPEAALAEIHRVLRPGGTLTLTDWCDDYLTCKLCSLWLQLTDRAFHRAYTLRECRGMLARAGFVVVTARKFKINWLWGLMRLEARR
jgi:ubiquinone/menaquinone biosynthesis C-methylase UbiE